MNNPFSAPGQNPFSTPYQAPAGQPPAGGGFPAPASSPFLEGGLSKAFTGRDDFAKTPVQPGPVMQPKPMSPVDFTPAPVAMPVAAPQPMTVPRQAPAPALKPGFFLTSTSTVDGYTIDEYLGLVSIEVVVPKDVLFRNPAPHGDLHRLKAAEDQLQKVKDTALEELSQRARGMGADGIVGLTLQFSQFDTIVCLCSAVGTAVKLSG